MTVKYSCFNVYAICSKIILFSKIFGKMTSIIIALQFKKSG